MLKIESVAPGSYAAELGLDAGDRLIRINGREIDDLIDYHLSVDAERLLLEVLRGESDVWEYELEKLQQEDIGLEVEHPHPRQCGNQCIFCFVHQLPKGMRRSLYVKDEDYRYSYLYGSYITLTNLTENDLQRIIKDHLSPLYISVHATDQAVRETLLGADVPLLMPLLERLTRAGIVLHCQIVLCPGINDGSVLQRSIQDLSEFYPKIASLAVVPVGLTKHRDNLPRLAAVGSADAGSCLETINMYQQRYLPHKGSRFVFAADEMYLLAGLDIPPLAEYEDCPQIENGIGMIAHFRQQAQEVLLEAEPLELDAVTLVTGRLFSNELAVFVERLSLRTGVRCEVVPIGNLFFGEDVTVAGLITGGDLLKKLAETGKRYPVLIPDVMLKGGRLFLDDTTLEDVSKSLDVPVIAIESTPWGLYEGMECLAEGPEIIHC